MSINPAAAGIRPGEISAAGRMTPADHEDSLQPSLAIPLPPSLNARDLRLSILTWLKQYRRLRATLLPQRRRDPFTGDARDQGDAEARREAIDRQVQFDMVRTSLLIDIGALLQKTKALRRRLLARRWPTWLAHTIFALVSHAICARWIPYLFPSTAGPVFFPGAASYSRRLDGTLGAAAWLLQWVGYPLAMYRVATFERSLSGAVQLGEDLETMEKDVANGAEVRVTESLSDREMVDSLPWGESRI